MARLPEFIFDSHKRYKADTIQLTAWLVETAKELGYGLEPSLSTEGELPRMVPEGRFNGKARKKAPDAAVFGKTTASSMSQCKNIFVNDFIKLARFIASSHHRIKVPSLVLKLARSAIAVRKRCAEWFKQQTTQEEDISDNLSHWHFIRVLEQVVQILHPLCERDDSKSATVKTNPGEAASLANPFSHLDIEETKDEELFETIPPVVAHVPSSTSPSHPLVVYTVADDDCDDWLVAVYCAFEDLRDIGTFLHETWSDYRDKKIDLITASVTTNMAFEVIRSMQEGMLALNPKMNNYEAIARVLCSAECRRRGVEISAMELVDMLHLNMGNVVEFVYLRTYELVVKCREVIQRPGDTPVKKSGHLGIYDPCRSRDSLSWGEKILEDRIILFETLPNFILLGSLKGQLPVPDELTKELEKLVCDKEISLLLVFAIQVYLDIHHVMREQVGRGFEDLRSAGAQVQISLRLRSLNSPKEKFKNWPAWNEMGVKMLETFIQEWILKDYLRPMLPDVETERYYLLSRHPFLCGMMQFRLQLDFQGLGMVLATNYGTILYVCHLYEAGKHAGFLEHDSWKDMEWIMKVHNKERMFRGRVPQNVTESYNSLCLMLGVSTTYFASTSRAEKKHQSRQSVKHSPKGPSFFKENSPVSAMFKDRAVRGGVALTAEGMEDLLADIGVDPSLQLSEPQTKLQRQWAQSQKVTSLQFLAAIKAAMVAEQHMIRFDYVSLHMLCFQILREIKATLHDKFVRYYGERYIENESELPFLVGYILISASDHQPGIGDKIKKLRDGALSNMMLMPASEVVDAFIKREGDAECAKLEKVLQQRRLH